jgi:hypothetical protein
MKDNLALSRPGTAEDDGGGNVLTHLLFVILLEIVADRPIFGVVCGEVVMGQSGKRRTLQDVSCLKSGERGLEPW